MSVRRIFALLVIVCVVLGAVAAAKTLRPGTLPLGDDAVDVPEGDESWPGVPRKPA